MTAPCSTEAHVRTIDEKTASRCPQSPRRSRRRMRFSSAAWTEQSTSIRARGGGERGADQRARLAHPRGARDEALRVRGCGRDRARQAGPRARTARSRRHASLGRDVAVVGVDDHIEIWNRPQWAATSARSKGASEMLPNVQRTDAAHHVPVLRGGAELLDVQRGRRSSMPRSAPAGIRERSSPTSLEAAIASRSTAIRRSGRTSTGSRRPRGACRRVSCAAIRGRPLELAVNDVRATLFSSTSASPRCRSTVPSAGSRTRPSAARHRDGPSDDKARPTSSRRTTTRARDIFKRYEKSDTPARSHGIARNRVEEPIERTGQLVDIMKASIPVPARFGEGHPAKRVFQALRIEVLSTSSSRSKSVSRRRSQCSGREGAWR